MPCVNTVYVIQHVAVETPALIAATLKRRGIGIEMICPFRDNCIPSRMGDHDGLVVMGGPMGVYEQDQYPFLREEIQLILDALNKRRPILGICLGSQLLAAALGAPVTRGRQKEIGWHSVTLSAAAAQDTLWRGLPESFTAFHWHGDVFELPRDATPLAWSKLTEHQAFRYGDSAYGLLFHLEVTEQIIGRMTRTFQRELRGAGLSERTLLADATKHLPRLQAIGEAVFARWAELVKGENVAKLNQATIRTKRVYEPATPADGARFLVDCLWPRGVSKAALRPAMICVAGSTTIPSSGPSFAAVTSRIWTSVPPHCRRCSKRQSLARSPCCSARGTLSTTMPSRWRNT